MLEHLTQKEKVGGYSQTSQQIWRVDMVEYPNPFASFICSLALLDA